MKKVFGILAFLSFMFLLGSVGAVEQNRIDLGTGTVHMVLGVGGFGIFTRLAGGFDPYVYKESRPRCSRPKGGKRKSSQLLYHKF